MKKAFLYFLLLTSIIGSSQILNLPSIPSAASFEKYSDIPVGLSTGTANIEVPIYNIKHNNFNFPLTLRYHTSGIKVNEYNPDIGLGWNLNFSGMISQNIIGVDDYSIDGCGHQSAMTTLYQHFYGEAGTPTTTTIHELGEGGNLFDLIGYDPYYTQYDYAFQIFQRETDGASDEYSYYFLDKSGRFILNESLKPQTIPYDDIKIEKNIYGNGFMITNNEGIKFFFTSEEEIENYEIESIVPDGGYFLPPKNKNWKLSKILFLDGEHINFNYEAIEYNFESLEYIKNNPIPDLLPSPIPINYIEQSLHYTFNVVGKRLTQITTSFNNLTVDFTYGDINDTPVNVLKPLTDITINDNGNPIETIFFNHASIGNKRFSLGSIAKQGEAPYFFTYYNNIHNFPAVNSSKKDLWGYYNSHRANNFFEEIFNGDLSNAVFYEAGDSKQPDFNSTLTGTLRSITYPTGGKKDFIYEQNQYYGTRTIRTPLNAHFTFNGFGEYEFDSFTFNEDTAVNINGFIDLVDNDDNPSGFPPPGLIIVLHNETTNTTVWQWNSYEHDDGSSDINFPVSISSSSAYPVILKAGKTYKMYIYNYVDQLRGHVNLNWNEYNDFVGNINAGGLRVKQIVTKDYDDNVLKTKTFSYNKPDNLSESSGYLPRIIETGYKHVIYGYYHANGGVVNASRRIFTKRSKSRRKIPNTAYQFVTVQEEDNKTIYEFSKYFDHLSYGPDTDGAIGFNKNFSFLRHLPLSVEYKIKKNGYYSKIKEIKSIFNSVYNPFDLIGLNVNYNIPPVLLTILNGSGVVADVKMEEANYKVIPISRPFGWPHKVKETTTYFDTNENPTIETITNYFYENNNHLQLTKTTTTDSNNNTLETKIFYPQDKSQLTNLTVEATTAIDSLITQHRIAVPIQIENKKNSQIISKKRINFKDWGVNITGVNNIIKSVSLQTAKGTNSLEDKIIYHNYDNKGNILDVSKANGIHTSYIWGYNKTQPIAKIENIKYIDIPQAELNALLNFNYTTGSEASLLGKLADLRNVLPNTAMATTMTYKPLIGLSTITDPKGDTQYYIYDGFNRLKFVKDTAGNILSENEYHYRE